MKKILYAILHVFLKITGFIPFVIFLKPKYFYVSKKAKKDYKKHRKGALLISNHTGIMDYYCFVLKKCFQHVHTFVGEVVYMNKFMYVLNEAMQNIRVDRYNGLNVTAVCKAIDYLKKGKTVLIFPEGKIEEKTGVIEKFNTSFAYISMKSGKPIIPHYIDGRYGLFKRPTIVVGEAIYPEEVDDENITEEKINAFSESICRKVKKMGIVCRDHKRARTKKIFTRKYWLLDFCKATSIPWFYLIFPTKRIFYGSKKKIKTALKDNVLIAGNHAGPCDPLFVYFHFFSRRVRIVTAEEVYCAKFLSFVLDRSGTIKYRRAHTDTIDMQAFKESIETLNGKGAVAIFPEGHINFDCSFGDSIKEGASAMSLMTNSPIIPFMFVNPYKMFKLNKVVFGDPIYPSDYIDDLSHVDQSKIKAFNEIIYNKLKEIYNYSVTLRSKNFGEKDFYKPY